MAMEVGIEEITKPSTGMPTIPEFYAGRTIFITGATGFLGKVLVEKLLRSCPDIEKIYVLIRPKSGKSASQRLEAILHCKLFDKVRSEHPGNLGKVIAINGDIVQPNIGITEEDMSLLTDEVSVVFHSAATVKFDEHLRLAVRMNMVGVTQIIALCRNMPKLAAFVHVSTAYANCDREQILECIYPPPMSPEKLMDAVEWMDDNMCDAVTPFLIDARPNTYTYTKAMAEWLVVEGKGDIPTAIVRPSIVGASWREPFPGWIDNYNGATGLMIGIGKGLLRTMRGVFGATADIVPVDIPVNMMLGVGWYTGIQRPEKVLVYHATASRSNQCNWGSLARMIHDSVMKNPVEKVIRVPNPRFTPSSIVHKIEVIFSHLLPAFLMDLGRRFLGRKPILMRLYDKLHKAVANLDYFTSHEWDFAQSNSIILRNLMSEEDRKIFSFDAEDLQWDAYIDNYILGAKVHVLKEDLAGLPAARKHMRKLQAIQYMLQIVLFCIVWRFLIARTNISRKLWHFVISLSQKFVIRLPMVTRSS